MELTVEPAPGGYVAADWSVLKKTDKSGHFRVTPPEDTLKDAPKFFMMIDAVAFKPGWTQKSMNASIQAQGNGACLFDYVQASFADARYNLISTRTRNSGGCLQPKDIHPNEWSWWYNPPPLEVFAPFLNKLWDASLETEAFRSIKGDLDIVRGDWSTNLVLPGAQSSQCRILTANTKRFAYRCSLEVSPGEETQWSYVHLANLVEQTRKDWDIRPSSPTMVTFQQKDELEKSPSRLIRIARDTIGKQAKAELWVYWESH